MSQLLVYFCRAMDARSQKEILEKDDKYRRLLESINASMLNPFKCSDRKEANNELNIAQHDLSLLKGSEVVLADLSDPNYLYVGCIFEIVHATLYDIPVILVVGENDIGNRIFFQAFCDFIAKEPYEAIEYIRRAYTSEGIDSQMKEMHAYYDRIAREYEEESVRTHKRDQENMGPFLKARSELRDIIKNSAEGTVCQIGIGTGDWTRAVCETAKIVVGVEVSQEMLAKAKHNLASFDNVYFVNCDFLKEDIEAGPFDCVVVFFLLSLFPRSQQDLFFHQVQKILKPKGLLVVADTKKLGDLPSIGLGRRQLQQRRSGDKVYTLYKEHFFNDSLASLLEGKGYEIIDRSIGTTWFSWVVSCRRT